MYDDFFFPYEKAKLWTGNMFLLSLSNFLLYASLYMMLPVLPLWMVRHWYCSYAEAGAAIAVFGLAMFLPGTFNSYLIDTFKRKSVCFIAIFDSGGESSFPCSAQHFMVLAGPFFAAAHFVAGDEYDDGGHYLWDIGGTYLQ